MAVSPRNSEGSAKRTTKEIRQWAIGEGREVSPRGRIPAEIERAFHDAQAETAPARKVAAKRTTKEIRQWAIGEGREVSPRGRIPAEIERAFHDAQAETAPARKVAAKKS